MAGAMSRTLQVRVTGKTDDLEKAYSKAGKSTDKFGMRLKDLGKVAGAAAVGQMSVQALATGIRSSVDAAEDAQKAQVRLQQSLASANVSYATHGKAIDAAIQKTSKLAALDDEELSDVFARLVRSTGNVKEAMDGMNLAAEIARGRGVSLEAAAKGVEKAYLGSDAALKKFGITVPAVSSHVEAAKAKVEALKEAHDGKLSPALAYAAQQMMKEAQEADKTQRAHDALAKATDQFAGSADRYGKSAAGAHDRQKVAIENLQESIGGKLLPAWNAMLSWSAAQLPKISAFFDEHSADIKRVLGAVGGFIRDDLLPIFKTVGSLMVMQWTAVVKVFRDNKEDIDKVLGGMKTLLEGTAKVMQFLVEKVVTPILKPVFTTVLPIALGITVKAIAALVDVVSAVKTGFEWIGSNAARIFLAVKEKLKGPLETMAAIFAPVADVLRRVVYYIERVIELAGKVGSAVGKITGAIGGVVGKIPGLATGGPLAAGQAAVVGERGPELFVPNVDGRIVTNEAAFGSGSASTAGIVGGAQTIIVMLDGRELWSSVQRHGLRDSRYIVGRNDLVGALQ